MQTRTDLHPVPLGLMACVFAVRTTSTDGARTHRRMQRLAALAARLPTGVFTMDLLRPLQPVQLTTMGRRTGRPHTVTLLASPFEAGLVVTTCMGRDPDWIRNLRRNAHATVVADDSTFPVVGSFPVGLDRTNAVAAFCASRNRLIAAMTRRLVSGEAQTCPDMVVLSPC